MKLGPPWRVDQERLANLDQLAAPVASVLAPLPVAIGAALINANPQSAIATLVMLSFPVTLIVGLQFFLVRKSGLIGWASFVVAGLIAAGMMMNLLEMKPPPANIDVVTADTVREAVGPVGAFFEFVVPAVVTSLAFWLGIRLRSPRVFLDNEA